MASPRILHKVRRNTTGSTADILLHSKGVGEDHRRRINNNINNSGGDHRVRRVVILLRDNIWADLLRSNTAAMVILLLSMVVVEDILRINNSVVPRPCPRPDTFPEPKRRATRRGTQTHCARR